MDLAQAIEQAEREAAERKATRDREVEALRQAVGGSTHTTRTGNRQNPTHVGPNGEGWICPCGTKAGVDRVIVVVERWHLEGGHRVLDQWEEQFRCVACAREMAARQRHGGATRNHGRAEQWTPAAIYTK